MWRCPMYITQAVGDRGKIFRIGGDEFVVLGQMTQTQAQEILAALQRIAAAWSGTNVRKSLACWNGCAAMKSGRAAKSFIAVLWTCGYGTERFLIMSK